jgi:hypothetical protein
MIAMRGIMQPSYSPTVSPAPPYSTTPSQVKTLKKARGGMSGREAAASKAVRRLWRPGVALVPQECPSLTHSYLLTGTPTAAGIKRVPAKVPEIDRRICPISHDLHRVGLLPFTIH